MPLPTGCLNLVGDDVKLDADDVVDVDACADTEAEEEEFDNVVSTGLSIPSRSPTADAD